MAPIESREQRALAAYRPSTAPAVRKKGQPPPPEEPVRPVRVLSASALRAKRASIRTSPEGPCLKHPLSTPACVECGHCGFPVWPEEADIATQRTFDKAKKMDLDKLRPKNSAQSVPEPEAELDDDFLFDFLDEPAQEDADAEIEESEAPDAEDEESVSTVEGLERQIEDLHDKLEKMQGQKDELEEERDGLVEERDDLKKQLEIEADRYAFLQASEMRFRDKLVELHKDMKEFTTILDRRNTMIGEREGYLVRSREECASVRKALLLKQKRWNELLDDLGVPCALLRDQLTSRATELMVNLLKSWRWCVAVEKLNRKFKLTYGDLANEIEDLELKVSHERDLRAESEAKTEQHRVERWQVGRAVLARTLSVTRMWRMRHAFRGWIHMHPLQLLKGSLRRLELKHDELQEQHQVDTLRIATTEAALADAKEQNLRAYERQGFLIEDLNGSKTQFGEILAERLAMARQEAEEELGALRCEMDHNFALKKQEWAEEKKCLLDDLHKLGEDLEMAELGGGGAGGAGGSQDGRGKKRGNKSFVPKGKGMMCIGCLKQVLVRDVMPLSSQGATSSTSAEAMEQMKANFFKEEFAGLLDPKDPVHSALWEQHKDPYGVTSKSLQQSRSLTTLPQQHREQRPASAGVAVSGRPPGGGVRALRSEVASFRMAWR